MHAHVRRLSRKPGNEPWQQGDAIVDAHPDIERRIESLVNRRQLGRQDTFEAGGIARKVNHEFAGLCGCDTRGGALEELASHALLEVGDSLR